VRPGKGDRMVTKEEIRQKALELGFIDAGFTTADPFDKQREILEARQDDYGWTEKAGLSLLQGTDPKTVHPEAKTVIVLVHSYFLEAFPGSLERHFGRCYLDDDRVTKDGLSLRIKDFRNFLRENGIDSKVPFGLPHRAAAARAGLGTLGKNCLFYSRRLKGSSWVVPMAVVVDREFPPDEPTVEYACPEWCRNACIAACPTRALKGNGTIDPRKCISFLTYYGSRVTPLELREPMGLYIYGCDRCQDVCPRNRAWPGRDLPENPRVKAMEELFDLRKLLAMDLDYFQTHIWPRMFYMGPDMLWKWKMNVARVMGNSLEEGYVPDLVKAYGENADERVRSMIAWALGRIGGVDAREALEGWLAKAEGELRGEIEQALAMIR
jgi:epoxyqueuosine reductase